MTKSSFVKAKANVFVEPLLDQAIIVLGTQVKVEVTLWDNPRHPSNPPCINIGTHDLYIASA